MTRLLLIGAGHSHLFVLQGIIEKKLPNTKVILVNPVEWQYYSGMIPGWMAGHYGLDECRIHLRPLAQAAGVSFVQDIILGIDAGKRQVHLASGAAIAFDFLSINIGSGTDESRLAQLGKRLLPIKPLSRFVETWPSIAEKAADLGGLDLIVVGGGAAGIELAFAARYMLEKISSTAKVTLMSGGPNLVPGQTVQVRKRLEKLLTAAGISIVPSIAVGTEKGVMLSNGRELEADFVIAATGARPPSWLDQSHLALSHSGFIEVDQFHRSRSHENIFAAGDICARREPEFRRSGVHAVRAGPILAHNLRASLTGGKLIPYRPPAVTLQILACGRRYGIATWGRQSVSAVWAWKWKDRIDRRFVSRFQYP